MSAPDVVWVNVQAAAPHQAVGVSYATEDAATSAAIQAITIGTVRYVRAATVNAWHDDPDYQDWLNETFVNMGDEWDGDDAMEDIAARYVAHLEAHQVRDGDVLIPAAVAKAYEAIWGYADLGTPTRAVIDAIRAQQGGAS